MTSIIIAFQFLTISPMIIKRMFTSQEMGRAVAWFPLVGFVLGLCLFFVNYFLQLIFPISVATICTLIAWIILTRAFHLDGFMDTCDGLFGGFISERRLEIMKDSRMGAFGTIGCILILLTEFVALQSLGNLFASLILATTFGRFSSVIAIYFFPYAREKGLGAEMKKNITWRELVISFIITSIVAWFVYAWFGLFFMLISIVVTILFAFYIMRLIPGLTGDIYGAITTIIEVLILLLFTIQ